MKKGKGLKKGLLLALLLAVMAGTLNVQAAGKDVTKSMSKNSGLKKIVRDITKYTTVEMAGSTKKVTVSMKNSNLFSMAGYVGANSYHKTGFTKAEIQKLTYNLFGKKPSVSVIPKFRAKGQRWIARRYQSWQKKPYVYTGGDWGTYYPVYKITRIVKVKTNVYDVTVTNKLGSYETKTTRAAGTTTIRIKKNTKSSYGFVITKLTYKGNGQRF
ncbi:MAG: hypothetical protein Q4C61_00190 [Lachnospiraceae bacterium]|nr:hypothetical protein [Lachnospiraceae bacterium]